MVSNDSVFVRSSYVKMFCKITKFSMFIVVGIATRRERSC